MRYLLSEDVAVVILAVMCRCRSFVAKFIAMSLPHLSKLAPLIAAGLYILVGMAEASKMAAPDGNECRVRSLPQK